MECGWKMSLNVVKCGILMFGPGEGVRCSVLGTPIRRLQHCTYLDLSMTADLDLTTIMQDRKEKTTYAYHAMRLLPTPEDTYQM